MAEIVRLDHSAFARDGLCHRRPTVLYIAWQELPYRIMCERCHVEWGRYATLEEAPMRWNRHQKPLSFYIARARERLANVQPLPLP